MKAPAQCPTCRVFFVGTEDTATGRYKRELHDAKPGDRGICTNCQEWWELQPDGSVIPVEPDREDWERVALWLSGGRSN